MVLFRSLSSFLLPVLALLSLSARALPHARTASKKATLQLAVKLNSNGAKSIADADRARAKALLEGGRSSSISIANSMIQYTADIGVGTPPTYYTLLIDTGSSNTWIGASQTYVRTSTSLDVGVTFSITYGSGLTASGEEYVDHMTINSDLAIKWQYIGVVDPGDDAGLSPLDGILGVGPVDLTEGTVSNMGQIPTVMDSLYAQNTISSDVLGIFFAPASADNTGELTFGGYDASQITGDVNYVPITSKYPSSHYWGVEQFINYGVAPIMGQTAGIIDTGTTFILIPTDCFQAYQMATGATLDDDTGYLTITSDQYDSLSSLYFTIGDVSYELTPNGQIWPRSLNYAMDDTTDSIYLVILDIGYLFGTGMDFINGYLFLVRFYSVFDTTNSQVGFATTEYTYATTN